MSSYTELERLVDPLVERSAYLTNIAGFKDQAAYYVLEKLGMAKPDLPMPRLKTARIDEAQWVDDKIRAFLNAHPAGQGLEVNSGISTRFHRLSWQLINPNSVDTYLNYVFTRLDNFRTVASETPITSWPKYTKWQHSDALIVVLGEDKALNLTDVLALRNSLDSLYFDALHAVELLLYHTGDAVAVASHLGLSRADIVDTYSLPKKNNIAKQLMCFFGKTDCQERSMISHIRLNCL